MTAPSLPAGYDTTKHVRVGRGDCHITVGFDTDKNAIRRFLVLLHYQVDTDPVRWEEIARMDHNETAPLGHNVYREGLHVDVARQTGRTVHLTIRHPPLPSNTGKVIRGCVTYLEQYAQYFIDVYEGRRSPGGPPRWSPDGGDRPPRLISTNRKPENMSKEHPPEDTLSPEELSEVLAEATGTTAEEIETGADALELAPPSEADVVDE